MWKVDTFLVAILFERLPIDTGANVHINLLDLNSCSDTHEELHNDDDDDDEVLLIRIAIPTLQQKTQFHV